MEWTQIAAWIIWAWIGLTTVFASIGLVAMFMDDGSGAEVFKVAPSISAAFALNAILGLMLIQTLGLAV